MLIKKIIPYSFKLKIKIWKRMWEDRKIIFSTTKGKIEDKNRITTVQEIKTGILFENKQHNIKLASEKIEQIIIKPNETFSFWKIVNRPSKANNFKVGRNIIQGKISKEYGGGICQLSSIIYHTVIKADLEIIERFNHSVDIYKENERFTPLGADATVVYGYKDLRFKNTTNTPIQFRFIFNKNMITCHLTSEKTIPEKPIEFIRDYSLENFIIVFAQSNGKIKTKSQYRISN